MSTLWTWHNFLTTTNSINYKLLYIIKKTLTYNISKYLKVNVVFKINIFIKPKKLRLYNMTSFKLHIAKNKYGSRAFKYIALLKWNRLHKFITADDIFPSIFKQILNNLLKWILFTIYFRKIFSFKFPNYTYHSFLFRDNNTMTHTYTMYSHTYTYSQIHTYKHTRTHTNKHTHTYIYIYSKFELLF